MAGAGATLPFGAWASHCGGISCCGARALAAGATVVVACGFSSCGARTKFFCGVWNLPGPGIEPMSPALAGGFLSMGPSGKSSVITRKCKPDLTVGTSATAVRNLSAVGVIGPWVAGVKWQRFTSKVKVGVITVMDHRVKRVTGIA